MAFELDLGRLQGRRQSKVDQAGGQPHHFLIYFLRRLLVWDPGEQAFEGIGANWPIGKKQFKCPSSIDRDLP